MTMRVISPSELRPDHLDAWRGIQMRHAELDRPFFAPEYFQIIGEVRADARIALIEQRGEIRGFFPFQNGRGKTGRPVGLRLSDFQGMIAPPDLEVDGPELLRTCGLSVWHFDHLLVNQAGLKRFHRSLSASPYVDLRNGFDAYLAERRAAGATWVSKVPRKARKMGREIGPLRFEFDCRDKRVFQQVREWKSQQRLRTQSHDLLRLDWVTRVLDRIFATNGREFAGSMSALFAGSRLVAAHFGMRSRKTLHLWFPAYDRDMEAYSPGILMHLELFRAAADAGIERVDFGAGREPYKLSMTSNSTLVSEGCIDTRPIGHLLTGAWYAGKMWLRNSPFGDAVQGPKRQVRRLMRWIAPGNS